MKGAIVAAAVMASLLLAILSGCAFWVAYKIRHPNFTNCGVYRTGVLPLYDADHNDPSHAHEIVWTQLDCDEARITLWGRLSVVMGR